VIQRPPATEALDPPPYAGLRGELLAEAEALTAGGQPEAAGRLAELTERWWTAQLDWDARILELLHLHHDINNALVGVSGNAQLMLRDPVAGQPGVRERLEVMLREAGRIQAAAAQLRVLKRALEGVRRDSRAA
jgi:signal transduction histidine kinase